MIRLLVCDDNAGARQAVRVSLEHREDVVIVGEAANGEEAIALAVALSPEVVLMDVAMPLVDGVEATRRIRDLCPSARIVAFAGSDETEVVMAMMDAGASAYCLKGVPLWELERAIVGAGDPLVRLAQGLARAVGHGGVGDLVARELLELTGAAVAVTYLSAPELGLSLAGMAGAGDAAALASAPGVAARAFDEVVLAHADAHELAELYRLGIASAEATAAPLVSDGKPLGALLVVMPAQVQMEVDVELLSAVADLAAASIANERRLALTFAEARRDALTGLPNKRAFDEDLARALCDGQLTTVLLFDLDDFKQINDREGHPAGDRVLRNAARAVSRALRTQEEAYRVGGEEFAVLVSGDADAATHVAARIGEAFRSPRLSQPLPTFSAGIAAFPADADSAEELLRKADVALYTAKWAGKDQVVVYGGEGGESPAPPPTRVRGHLSLVEPGELHLPLGPTRGRGTRILLVDDDPALRILLRTTFEVVDIEVAEAADTAQAEELVALRRPDVVVLDVGLPGRDGLTYCRQLKADPATRSIGVVLLTGAEEGTESAARVAGADAFLRKPFSPLELLSIVSRLAGGLYEGPFGGEAERPPEEQILLYAQDLRRLLDVERGQRSLLQKAYRETVTALTTALESKDVGTGAHSQRVQRYALELARAMEPSLVDDPSVEYGFLLHDVGKIGIPDSILLKPAPLTRSERGLMRTHTVLGEQMLGGIALLQGEGLRIVRSHHERWDGRGYPDGLLKDEASLGARIFGVADTLDAMTSERPYRPAASWDDAVAEILRQSRRQFDPAVVEAFRDREARLKEIRAELAA